MIRQLVGDCRETLRMLEPGSVQSCITSPPYYGLRDYGTPPLVWDANKHVVCTCGRKDFCAVWCGTDHEHEWQTVVKQASNGNWDTHMDQSRTMNPESATRGPTRNGRCVCGAWLGSLGLEPTPELYLEHIVEVFREVRRVLRDDGCIFVNMGDSYAGSGKGPSNGISLQGAEHPHSMGLNGGLVPQGLKPKDLMMMPARVAMALQADGWYLRSMIPWLKRNSMPESVQGSHWSRHQVKIEEYEKLSGLRYTGERPGGAWSGDVRYLPPTAKPGSKATISTESARAGNTASTRAAAGRKGKATIGQPVATGENQQSEVRGDRERTLDAGEGDPEVQGLGPREGAAARARRTTEVSAGLARAKEGGGSTLAGISQGSHLESSDGGAAAGQDKGVGDGRSDDSRMAADPRTASPQMFLLQEAVGAVDNGSRHTSQSGRTAPERERSAGLPVVQFEEEQPSDDALVDCPGCDQCRSHGGYLFRLSAGRPSTSVEYVFLFSKSASYFWDADAVRVPQGNNTHSRGSGHTPKEVPMGQGIKANSSFHAATNGVVVPGGRNRRNGDWFFESWQGLMLDEHDDPLALVVNPMPFKGSHFATFPAKLVEPMVKASTRPGDTILDPFSGAGTVGLVADRLGRDAVLCELSDSYGPMATARIVGDAPMFVEMTGGGMDTSPEPVKDKQAALGKRTYSGFNARWDAREAAQ